ncbi:MAG: hypothetical protein WBQ75_07275 [Acetobacteraceae bacterium]
MPDLVEPVFLMAYSDADPVSDYRCVVNVSASQVIFERTSFQGGSAGPTLLYVLDLMAEPPVPPPSRLNDVSPAFRPDWCWATGKITFMDSGAVYIQDSVSSAPTALSDTPNMAYPTWSAAGDFIVTENGDPLPGYPNPRTTKIDPVSGRVIAQVSGTPLVWGGMPTVNPRDSARIAFAGQWIGTQTSYDQDRNYIWLADDAWQIDRDVAAVRPLDPQANVTGPFRPEFQGRAPWFSPDGEWIVFESVRADPKGELYALFIQRARGDGPARQVTDVKWNANHAKFYPNGRYLVATLLQAPGAKRRGIAMLDVSAFVG